MKKADIQIGTIYAVVNGGVHRRGGEVDKLQSAYRVEVTGFSEGGQPTESEHLGWRAKEEYRRRTVVGILVGDRPAYGTLRPSERENCTVYFEPRRVLCTWDEREELEREREVMRRRHVEERKAKDKEVREQARQLRGLQKRLGLDKGFGYRDDSLFETTIYGDGSFSFDCQASPEQSIRLLERLVELVPEGALKDATAIRQ